MNRDEQKVRAQVRRDLSDICGDQAARIISESLGGTLSDITYNARKIGEALVCDQRQREQRDGWMRVAEREIETAEDLERQSRISAGVGAEYDAHASGYRRGLAWACRLRATDALREAGGPLELRREWRGPEL